MTKYSPDPEPGTALPMDEKTSRILRSLANQSPTSAPSSFHACKLSEDAIGEVLWAWRERSRYLPEDLFSDPSWGMLLELLMAEIGNRRISLSRLCKTTAETATTAVRWIKALEDRDLIHRRVDPQGGGSEFVELTPNASAALRCYFRDMLARE